jgi:hypothetical protein
MAYMYVCLIAFSCFLPHEMAPVCHCPHGLAQALVNWYDWQPGSSRKDSQIEHFQEPVQVQEQN